MTVLFATLTAFLSVAVAGAAPVPTLPTDADWADLVEGEVVTRNAPELSPPGAYAWVEIEATPDTIWAVLNDPEQAAMASGAVKTIEVYLDEPTADGGRRLGLYYVLNVAFSTITYSVVRDFRPAEGWMTWTLDPAREHDLVSSEGHYVVQKGRSPDHSLLIYKSQADSGRSVPQWVQQMLSGRALKKYLAFVQQAAEQA